MRSVSLLVALGFQIAFGTAFCSGAAPLLPPIQQQGFQSSDLEKFAGYWYGTFNQTNPEDRGSWVWPFPMILQIQPGNGQQVVVRTEWPVFRSRTTGPGIVTPHCISWVETDALFGRGVYLFGRYVATISTNNELTGKCYSEENLEVTHSFVLKKTDLRELTAFHARNAGVLQRLNAVSRNLDFLDPAWQKIMRLALRWINETLAYDYWIIDDSIIPDLEYADELANALVKRENLFALKATSEIPLSFDSGGDFSINIVSYRVSLPKKFPSNGKKFPLWIDLHGGGETRRRTHFIQCVPQREGLFIIVRPHSAGSWDPKSLNTMFSELKTVIPVDEDRVYLSGGSMGGAGTYKWAMANPELFAAISPMCGLGEVFQAPRLKHVPTWIFHGERDENVPFWFSVLMVNALNACGGNVKHTFFPEGKHNISKLIDSKALENWFLSHTRSTAPAPLDPVESLKLDVHGVGPKQLMMIPEQRMAALESQPEAKHADPGQVYRTFERAGIRSHGLVQFQFFPRREGAMSHWLLPISNDLELKPNSENVTATQVPASRALSFTYMARTKAAEDKLIASGIEELRKRGEVPSGEVRRTRLTTFGKDIRRIEILVQ